MFNNLTHTKRKVDAVGNFELRVKSNHSKILEFMIAFDQQMDVNVFAILDNTLYAKRASLYRTWASREESLFGLLLRQQT